MKGVSIRWVGKCLLVEHSRGEGDKGVAYESINLVVAWHREHDRFRRRWNGDSEGEERAAQSLTSDELQYAINGVVVVGKGEGETSGGLLHVRRRGEELFA